VRSFVDRTASAGSIYSYRVYAFNAAGSSPPSNVVSARPPG
jgi:hypothetical protein